MHSNIVFKGSKQGLHLLFDEQTDFATLLEQLKLKLVSAGDFFANSSASVYIPDATKRFTPEQQLSLTELFYSHGLVLQDDTLPEETDMPVLIDGAEDKTEDDQSDHDLIINKTVRNGQEIVHRGSVIVDGDVNPGAKIIAGKDIIVRGTCRGFVYAGASGDTTATITANRLLASQIRIASLISRAPDKLDIPEEAETARIKNGIVVIEPAK